MKVFTLRNAVTGMLMAMLLPMGGANAQLNDLLKSGESSGASGGMGAAGSALLGQSMTAGSTGNVVGVLEFCLKNNFLGGTDASSVKDKLMGKLGGGAAKSDEGYQSGAKGILTSGNGQQLDLSGSGVKAEMTKQVCDNILAQGKALL